MTRPMSEEREKALEAARKIVDRHERIAADMRRQYPGAKESKPTDALIVARALLSAERGMREAAIALNDEIDRMWNDVHRFNPPSWESHAKATCTPSSAPP